jgi:hypothetical protein
MPSQNENIPLFGNERDGQEYFFIKLMNEGIIGYKEDVDERLLFEKIDKNDVKIPDIRIEYNTDGFKKSILFEFKKNFETKGHSSIISIKKQLKGYLSDLINAGEYQPKYSCVVDLNNGTTYIFDNANFSDVYTFNWRESCEPLKQYIKDEDDGVIKYLVNENNILGLAEQYYKTNTGNKKEFFDTYLLKDNDKFIKLNSFEESKKLLIKIAEQLDKLNDKTSQKISGAFYTPDKYVRISTKYVRNAIKDFYNYQKEHPECKDYVIIDRCAGTGQLEKFLTDKQVKDITIRELDNYLDEDLKNEYLNDKDSIYKTHYKEQNYNNITIGQLEIYKTDLSIYDYLNDDELSHCILNTYEIKEWVCLSFLFRDKDYDEKGIELMEDEVKYTYKGQEKIRILNRKIRKLIPPTIKGVTGQFIENGNALTETFLNNFNDEFEKRDKGELYIIMLENPPFRNSSGNINEKREIKNNQNEFVWQEMSKDKVKFKNNNISSVRDIANRFIYSAFKYIIPNDIILFAPINYWKSVGLINKEFIEGYITNRLYYGANESGLPLIHWKNKDVKNENLILDNDYGTKTNINLLSKSVNEYIKQYIKSEKNKLGYIFSTQGTPNYKHGNAISMENFDKSIRGIFNITKKDYTYQMPIFVANCFEYKDYTEIEVLMKSADKGILYQQDKDFLHDCLVYTLLTNKNKCSKTCEIYSYGFSLLNNINWQNKERYKNLADIWNKLFSITNTYGLNNIEKDENNYILTQNIKKFGVGKVNKKMKDNIAPLVDNLKIELKKFYIELIRPKMLEYELVK